MAEMYANQHFGFNTLFDRAMKMMAGKENAKRRVIFCEAILKKVPRQRGDIDERLGELNPSYLHVAEACAGALRDAGMEGQAERLEASLVVKKR